MSEDPDWVTFEEVRARWPWSNWWRRKRDANMSEWRKAQASGHNGCVEVRQAEAGVQVRDSKDQAGPVLTFTATEWAAFLDGVRAGEFDR